MTDDMPDLLIKRFVNDVTKGKMDDETRDKMFREFNEMNITSLSPLSLAYVGDSVHELYLRSLHAQSGLNVNAMHHEVVECVQCDAQARALEFVTPLLTEKEAAIVKRARNARPRHSAPKSAKRGSYSKSTAFEALLGYLYLTDQYERLAELMDKLYGLDDMLEAILSRLNKPKEAKEANEPKEMSEAELWHQFCMNDDFYDDDDDDEKEEDYAESDR